MSASRQKLQSDAKAATLDFLELRLQQTIEAMNSRQFDPSLPPWSNLFSPDFYVDYEHPVLGPMKQDATGHLSALAAFSAANPQHRSRLADMSVVKFSESQAGGHAEVSLLMESWGAPTNEVRQSLVLLGWTKIDGRWYVCRYQGVRGMAEGCLVDWWGPGKAREDSFTKQ